jgi:signal transduction histidine kinase
LGSASPTIERVALEIALGRYEVGEAFRVSVDRCLAVGAVGVRLSGGGRVVEGGATSEGATTFAAGDVVLQVWFTPDAEVDCTSLVEALARVVDAVRVAEERRRAVHDLRGLLAVVSGQTEMLATAVWGPVSPAQRKALGAIERQLERISPLIERLRG